MFNLKCSVNYLFLYILFIHVFMGVVIVHGLHELSGYIMYYVNICEISHMLIH